MTVCPDGSTISALLHESSGYDILDDSAFDAVMAALYHPGSPGATVIVSVLFKLT